MIEGLENKMKEKRERERLNSRQLRLILLSNKIGREIARDYPQIAENYKQGDTKINIIQYYDLTEKYGVEKKALMNGVGVALEILISKEERLIIEKQHQEEAGQKTYAERTGIFSLSPEELKEIRIRGGKNSNGGQKTYEMGKGIFALSDEEKRKAIIKAVISRGHKPYSKEEKKYLSELSDNPNYQYKEGTQKHRPNYNLISEELKEKYGIKRSAKSIKDMLYHLRKATK